MNINIFFKLNINAIFAVFFIFNIPNLSVSQNSNTKNNSLNIEWGNTIYGNTISIGYNYLISKHFSSGISFGTGYFQYYAGNNNSFNWVKNIPGNDNTFSIDFKQIIDLKFDYKISRTGSFVFFNKFEIGLTYSHFLFKDQYLDNDVPWKGEKDYSWYLFSGGINFISYNPVGNENVNFDFGLKSRLTLTSSPMSLIYESPGRVPVKRTMICTTGTFFWFYPEIYLRINYNF